ncbi:MAG: pyridoxamine 5'-phosphate oxidase family protein [Defluviitaleaceae bacterium]|nr:pyridoxamine 5'-phosphate oxidase family protein [Defluviitaleaceae bacterium]
MNYFDKGMEILEEKFGNSKDNVMGLSTIALELGANGQPRPATRDIDAFYEDGVFYCVTWGASNKMKQIAANNEVAIAVNFAWFNANATGENLGWCMKPENAELRDKLRKAFTWYDDANDESNENCVYLAVRLTSGIININHHETLIYMDFINKTATLRGKEL